MLKLFLRVGPTAAFGIGEQAISSIANFTYIIFLSHSLDTISFGWFSIAWAAVMLVEALAWGLIGDGVPAIAVRIPRSNWNRLRGAMVLLSVIVAGAVAAGLLIAAALAAEAAPELVPVLSGSAIGVVGMRAQQLYRRLCYLDERRDYALYGTFCFAIALALFSAIIWSSGIGNSFVALAALGVASGMTMVPLLANIVDIAWPSRTFFTWATRRKWRSGRWLIASSLSFWVGNTGMVPLAGALYGIQASGSLRVLQNLATPLTQLSAVMFSIALPPVARILRQNAKEKIVMISVTMVALFAAVGISYVAVFTALGATLLNALFPGKAVGVSAWTIAIVMCSAMFDAIRSGGSVPMFAMGRTQEFFWARCASLVVLFSALFLLSSQSGLFGLCTSIALGNLTATIIVLASLSRMIRQTRRAGLAVR